MKRIKGHLTLGWARLNNGKKYHFFDGSGHSNCNKYQCTDRDTKYYGATINNSAKCFECLEEMSLLK